MATIWQKAFSRIFWKNRPNTDTPLGESKLLPMDASIDEIDDRVVTLQQSKAEQSDFLTSIKNIQFDKQTGVFTITKFNSTTFTIDTDLEKIAVNFDYDDDPTSEHYQQIILTLIDGTVKYIDLSAMITQYEFTDTATIDFSVDADGKISAIVVDGSITESKLQPNYLGEIRVETAKSQQYMTNAQMAQNAAETAQGLAEDAQEAAETAQGLAETAQTGAEDARDRAIASAASASTSETNASASATQAENSATNASTSASNASTSENNASTYATNAYNSATSANQSATSASDSAQDSEAWAVGKRNGVDVPSTDETYENNAKYYAEQAEESARSFPTKLSEFTNDAGFIDDTVNSLVNYYTKSQTYTQTEINNLIAAINAMKIEFVQTLPTADIDTHTIYFVPKQTPQTGDSYDEYINTDGTTSGWEHVGSTSIDLSQYYTKTQVDTLLADKADNTPTFTEATTRTNINSGETISTLFGKIKKWFSDLKTVAFSGSYNDLSDQPTIPTDFVSKASGGTFYGNVTVNGRDGTTSSEGASVITAGNNTATGTDKNSRGYVRLYSSNNRYAQLRALADLTGNRILNLPNKNGTLATTDDIPTSLPANGGTAANVSGTVAIENGGTGATTRLKALQNLTNENVGTDAQYFLTITSSWGKGGYTSVTHAKTVLGLKDLAYIAKGTSTTTYLRNDGSWATPPDTNTWRGIQNNLTSTSTTDSLSANQGRLLANGSARDSTKLPLSGGTLTGDLYISGSGKYIRLVNGSYTSYIYESNNGTANFQSGSNWLNLRAENIQCRNSGDSAWTACAASAFNVQSSLRYKENIEDITEETAKKLLDVRIVEYDYKDGVTNEDIHRYNQHGVIAEEIVEILPEVVNYAIPYGHEEEFDEPVPDGVDYAKFVPYLIKMVQMQQNKIDELTEEIKNVKQLISNLY